MQWPSLSNLGSWLIFNYKHSFFNGHSPQHFQFLINHLWHALQLYERKLWFPHFESGIFYLWNIWNQINPIFVLWNLYYWCPLFKRPIISKIILTQKAFLIFKYWKNCDEFVFSIWLTGATTVALIVWQGELLLQL